MTDPQKTDSEKPNWGNRIILLVFGLLAIVTIGATVFATTLEWDAGNFRSDQAASSQTVTEPPLTDIEETAPEAVN